MRSAGYTACGDGSSCKIRLRYHYLIHRRNILGILTAAEWRRTIHNRHPSADRAIGSLWRRIGICCGWHHVGIAGSVVAPSSGFRTWARGDDWLVSALPFLTSRF
jgi:hypothetical protein